MFKFKPQIAFFLAILFLISCDKDDDTNNNNSGNDPDNNVIMVSIDEYPNNGTELATLTSTLEGTVTYSITSVSITNSIYLNGDKVYVGNPFDYDYETTETITAVITATNGTDAENKFLEIWINDIDDIVAFLNASRDAYLAAQPGQWVKIMAFEYNDMANNMKNITRSGQTEGNYNFSGTLFSSSPDRSISQNNSPRLNSGEYLFAFKFNSTENGVQDARVKLSETAYTNGFNDVGSSLPFIEDGDNYYVLRSNDSFVQNQGYLAIYSSGTLGYKSVSGSSYYSASGNSNMISSLSISDQAYMYQGLSTNVKQWN